MAVLKTQSKTSLPKTGPSYEKAQGASQQLGDILAPVLVDNLIENCVVPAFADWRKGNIKSLNDVEGALNIRVQDWLGSDAAQKQLRPRH